MDDAFKRKIELLKGLGYSAILVYNNNGKRIGYTIRYQYSSGHQNYPVCLTEDEAWWSLLDRFALNI